MNEVYFLSLLFDPGEATCFSETPRGITISNNTSIMYNLEEKKDFPPCFFSINPMKLGETRCDAAVTKYRNILVEMDKMVLDLQDQYISEIDMPYSTAVFSGKKSIHYIISLEEPLQDEQVYRNLVRRVYRAVGDSYVDHSCKNPSRFSRFPGHLRADTGFEQNLLAIKNRVSLSTLEVWLEKRGAPVEEIWENLTRESRSEFKNPARFYGSTKNFLMFGAPVGEWNLSLFKAAADMYRCGFDEDEIVDRMVQITGTLDVADRKTISSAIKNEAKNER
jgi:hypothetical protein